MKKLVLLSGLATGIFLLSNCNPSKKTTTSTPVPEKAKSTYESNMVSAINTFCTPCHIPSKGGNKKPYDNYANVKTDIDEMIRRIELNPTDRGFMPFRKAKLSDSTINIFKQWKADGMLEK